MPARPTGILFAAAIAVVFGALSVRPSEARADGIPEIAVAWLDDVAMARWTASGPVIYYNPTRCTAVGSAVCSFIRMHEYGHIALNHASAYYSGFGGRALAEAEADCWAGRNARLYQVRAAIAYFLSPEMIDYDAGDHGTGRVRAKRIAECRGI